MQGTDESDFWKKVRRCRGGRSTCSNVKFGQAESAEEICEFWHSHFFQLRNLQDAVVLDQLNQDLDAELQADYTLMSWFRWSVTLDGCRQAETRLKAGKAAGLDGLQPQHFRFASDELFGHLAWLFSGISKHGCIPRQFHGTVVVPVVKNKSGDLNSRDNYRGIALSSVLGKLLENFIFSTCWAASDQHYGFKKGQGCDVWYVFSLLDVVCLRFFFY